MVTDDANGGTAAQQHEVRTRTQGARAVGPVGRWGHRRPSGRLCARCLLMTFLRQHGRDVVWVFAVCARELARVRGGKETTTALSR